MRHWAFVCLKLGALLLVIGAAPALAVGLWLHGVDPLIPFLLSLTVAPIGMLFLIAGLVMLAIHALRR